MKRFLTLAALTFSIAAFIPGRVHAEPRKLKLGISTPLTGDGVTWGFDIRDSLRFAVDKLAPGKFDLVLEDDRCNAKDAVSVAHKLIEVDKVDYVIGLACSAAALGAIPLYERAKIPVMIVGASSPKISEIGEYIFRTFPSDAFAAKLLFRKISERQQSVGIISAESDYAQDLKNAFVGENKSKALKILTEDYLPDTSDFRASLLRLKAANVQALFINTQYENTFALILKQLKQIDWHVQLYGAYWPGSAALQTLAGSDLEGVLFVDTPALDAILTAEGKSIMAEYTAKYGKLRSIEAVFAIAFEGIRALHEAISSGSDVRQFLYTHKFQGIFGPYSFDKNGDIQGLEFSFKKFENGKVIVLP